MMPLPLFIFKFDVLTIRLIQKFICCNRQRIKTTKMNKRIILLIACMLFIAYQIPLLSQELHFPDEYFLWQDQVPGSPPEEYPVENWRPDQKSDHGLVKSITHPTIRIFQPEQEKNTGTAIIICPGGGYNILVIEREGYNVARTFSKMGITSFVLKYRHYDVNAAVQDAHRSLRFVRANAEKWDIDPDRVGIGGFSAGGHLSLNAALTKEYNEDNDLPEDEIQKFRNNPDFLMLVYPGLSRFVLDPDQFRDGFPPVFMINAMDDDVTPVSNLFNLTQILKYENVSTEIHIYPGGGHGFDLGNEECHCSNWPDLFRDWLVHNRFIEK